jgi:hypothetical protein
MRKRPAPRLAGRAMRGEARGPLPNRGAITFSIMLANIS